MSRPVFLLLLGTQDDSVTGAAALTGLGSLAVTHHGGHIRQLGGGEVLSRGWRNDRSRGVRRR